MWHWSAAGGGVWETACSCWPLLLQLAEILSVTCRLRKVSQRLSCWDPGTIHALDAQDSRWSWKWDSVGRCWWLLCKEAPKAFFTIPFLGGKCPACPSVASLVPLRFIIRIVRMDWSVLLCTVTVPGEFAKSRQNVWELAFFCSKPLCLLDTGSPLNLWNATDESPSREGWRSFSISLYFHML